MTIDVDAPLSPKQNEKFTLSLLSKSGGTPLKNRSELIGIYLVATMSQLRDLTRTAQLS